ncbi:MAG TPA: porin [Polyangia bacterium]|nr:porin [Polyangia bacterium]
MKRNFAWLMTAALAAGLVLLVPLATSAQQGKKKAEKKEESKEAPAEVAEAEPEAESEAEPAPAEEEAPNTESLFGADSELVDDETADEKQVAGAKVEPKLLQGTWTKSVVFASDDGSFKFQPTGFVQPRFRVAIDPDADDALAGTGFTLKRARLGFRVTMFDWVRLNLDSDFSSGAARLNDYFADLDPFDGVAQLRAGYFRPWFGRQLLGGTTALQLIEYAQAWQDPALGLNLGRDLGTSIFGLVADSVEYGVGIWNGEPGRFDLGPGTTTNGLPTPGNIDFQVGGRIAVHPLAMAGVGEALPLGCESDLAYSEKPKLVIGGAFMFNKRHDREINVAGNDTLYYDNQMKIGAELAFQWKGIAAQGEFFALITKVQSDAAQEIQTAVDDVDGEPTGIGTYVQVGYFVLPHQLEIAARFDMVDEDTALRGMRLYPGLGGTWHFFGNNLKAQLMYRLNTQTGYGEADPNAAPPVPADPNWIPTTHEIFLMLQASI